jgi:hypothetical protein
LIVNENEGFCSVGCRTFLTIKKLVTVISGIKSAKGGLTQVSLKTSRRSEGSTTTHAAVAEESKSGQYKP